MSNNTRYKTVKKHNEQWDGEWDTSIQEEKMYILGDISETLALIYDFMKGDTNDEA